MVAGPEIARIVKKFESTFEATKPSDTRHHEQLPSVQSAFGKDVRALVSSIEEMGNPFEEDTADLLVLDTKEIMPQCVVEAVQAAEQKGQSQYEAFVEERLVKCSKAVSDTIQRNQLPLFGTSDKVSNKRKTQFAVGTIATSLHGCILRVKHEMGISMNFSSMKTRRVLPPSQVAAKCVQARNLN